jgi:hypothetical protein
MLPAKADIALKESKTAGGVEVVISTSSVPLCCDS